MTFAIDTDTAVRPGHSPLKPVVVQIDEDWESRAIMHATKDFFLTTNVELLPFEAYERKILTSPGVAEGIAQTRSMAERWRESLH